MLKDSFHRGRGVCRLDGDDHPLMKAIARLRSLVFGDERDFVSAEYRTTENMQHIKMLDVIYARHSGYTDK